MRICERCGSQRSSAPVPCGGCLAKARGEKPRAPIPLSEEERRIAEAFLGRVNAVIGEGIKE